MHAIYTHNIQSYRRKRGQRTCRLLASQARHLGLRLGEVAAHARHLTLEVVDFGGLRAQVRHILRRLASECAHLVFFLTKLL